MLDKKTANANIVLGLKLAILTVILFAGTMILGEVVSRAG
jgi:hypothetical protein